MQLNITEQDFDVICAGVGKLPIENAWPVFVKLQQQGQQHMAQKQSLEAAQEARKAQETADAAPPRQVSKNKGGRPRKVRDADLPRDISAVNGSGEPAQVMG